MRRQTLRRLQEAYRRLYLDEAARPGQRERGYARAGLQSMTGRRLETSGSPFRSPKAEKKLRNTERTAANAQSHYWQNPQNESYDAYDIIEDAVGKVAMISSNIQRPRSSGGTTSPTGPVTSPKPTIPFNKNKILNRIDSTLRGISGGIGAEIGARKGREQFGNIFGIPERMGQEQGAQKGFQMYDRAKEVLKGLLRQGYEYDDFNIILEHLITEGYANTSESAIAILENMSQTWIDSILFE